MVKHPSGTYLNVFPLCAEILQLALESRIFQRAWLSVSPCEQQGCLYGRAFGETHLNIAAAAFLG